MLVLQRILFIGHFLTLMVVCIHKIVVAELQLQIKVWLEVPTQFLQLGSHGLIDLVVTATL